MCSTSCPKTNATLLCERHDGSLWTLLNQSATLRVGNETVLQEYYHKKISWHNYMSMRRTPESAVGTFRLSEKLVQGAEYLALLGLSHDFTPRAKTTYSRSFHNLYSHPKIQGFSWIDRMMNSEIKPRKHLKAQSSVLKDCEGAVSKALNGLLPSGKGQKMGQVITYQSTCRNYRLILSFKAETIIKALFLRGNLLRCRFHNMLEKTALQWCSLGNLTTIGVIIMSTLHWFWWVTLGPTKLCSKLSAISPVMLGSGLSRDIPRSGWKQSVNVPKSLEQHEATPKQYPNCTSQLVIWSQLNCVDIRNSLVLKTWTVISTFHCAGRIHCMISVWNGIRPLLPSHSQGTQFATHQDGNQLRSQPSIVAQLQPLEGRGGLHPQDGIQTRSFRSLPLICSQGSHQRGTCSCLNHPGHIDRHKAHIMMNAQRRTNCVIHLVKGWSRLFLLMSFSSKHQVAGFLYSNTLG